MKKITLIKPDDWHLHLRDNELLQTTVPLTAKRFGKAIIMPNLKPPITNLQEAESYHQRILAAIPDDLNFQPLMTLYLTESMSPDIIKEANRSPILHAVKYYPAGVTTHSEAGVKQLEKIYPILTTMEEVDFPLLVHAESPHPDVDIFDREKYFLETTLETLVKRFPKLRIVVEHVSSEFGVNWIKSAPSNVGGTITAHHLLLNRNHLLSGGIHPHYYCLPVVKTKRDQDALIEAATSGNPKFFLGTDSAPHSQENKESPCGNAGVFTSHAAIELYAAVFEEANALDKLENFASFYGADFYRLPRNHETITLIKEEWIVPESYPYHQNKLIPLFSGEKISWKLQDPSCKQ